MGLQHECKKGTVIEVNGVRIEVLRGSPRLEISAAHDISIRECASAEEEIDREHTSMTRRGTKS